MEEEDVDADVPKPRKVGRISESVTRKSGMLIIEEVLGCLVGDSSASASCKVSMQLDIDLNTRK
ncbi:hypothetical protein HDU97_002232 [Phlyctochytrium planicorne]|nr:hypothetical protein HDU97_002232 [Phlyctochytrium planicorne]